MTVNGTDISHWNAWPNPDLHDFMFLKATESIRYIDPTFLDRVELIRATGKPWGAYHFLTTLSSVDEQMAHFHDTANLHSGEMAALDFEDDGTWRHWSSRTLADHAIAAMSLLLEMYPFNRVVLYCNRDAWKNIVQPYDVPVGDGLWIASPGQEPTMAWTFWQYGNGALDYDRANFDHPDDLRHWVDTKGATVKHSQQQLLNDTNYYPPAMVLSTAHLQQALLIEE